MGSVPERAAWVDCPDRGGRCLQPDVLEQLAVWLGALRLTAKKSINSIDIIDYAACSQGCVINCSIDSWCSPCQSGNYLSFICPSRALYIDLGICAQHGGTSHKISLLSSVNYASTIVPCWPWADLTLGNHNVNDTMSSLGQQSVNNCMFCTFFIQLFTF